VLFPCFLRAEVERLLRARDVGGHGDAVALKLPGPGLHWSHLGIHSLVNQL
jgi:hypothetical protein